MAPSLRRLRVWRCLRSLTKRTRDSRRSARMRRRTRTRSPLIPPPTWSTCPWRMWTGNPCCASSSPLRERRGATMRDSGSVLFLCPHNAAKSVLAAAYFDRLAVERGLPFRADSAGTEPAEGPAPAVVAALQAEGIDVSGYRPRHVEPARPGRRAPRDLDGLRSDGFATARRSGLSVGTTCRRSARTWRSPTRRSAGTSRRWSPSWSEIKRRHRRGRRTGCSG